MHFFGTLLSISTNINIMELQAKKRDQFGRAVKQIRKENLIPAELYGHGIENEHLSVNTKEFGDILNEVGESTVIDLVVDEKTHPVLIKDIHYHPVTDAVLNIDFYQVKMDEKITATVELEFVGESIAVKDLGGVLIKSVSELEVEAFPADLPPSIEVNLEALKKIGDSIQIKDLAISEKATVFADPETTIATVTEKMSEEADQAMSEEVDLSEIETEATDEVEEDTDKEATEEKATE